MSLLRRKTSPRAMPLPHLELATTCDQCGRHRAHGNHHACSRKRQAANRHKWESRP